MSDPAHTALDPHGRGTYISDSCKPGVLALITEPIRQPVAPETVVVTRKQQNNIDRTALFAYILTVILLMAASFLPGERLWGLSWYAYFGWPGRLILLLVVSTAPLVLGRLMSAGVPRAARERAADRRFSLVAMSVTLVLGLAFYLLRARTHFLGDGYLLLTRLAEGTQVIRPWNPAAYWVQNWAYAMFGSGGQSSALLAFQFISLTSGFLFMAAVSLSAIRLFGSFHNRLLFLLGAASGGYMLIFFGYVENYPLFVSVVAIFALTGILAERGLIGRGWILIPLGVAIPLHPFVAALAPATLYLLAHDTSLGRWIAGWNWWFKSLTLLTLAAGAVVGFHHIYVSSYFFRFAIVPFVENRFTVEGYSMFSSKHLIDFLNLLWQLQPAWLLLGLLVYRARSALKWSEYRFLLLLTAASLGIAFLFDPKLGMPRDWDLFCFAGVPLTLLAYLAVLDRRIRSAASAKMAALAVVLGIMILLPRAVSQAVPEISIELFDNYSTTDVYKNGGGRFLILKYLDQRGRRQEANRRRTANEAIAGFERWDRQGQALMRQGNYQAAAAKYHQVIDLFPCYPNAWTNLGIAHYQMRQLDSAIACLEISNGLNPFSMDVYHYLALAYYSAGYNPEAERLWLDMMELSPNDFRPYTFLLLMYDYDKRQDDYESLMNQVLTRSVAPNAPLDFIKRSAEMHLERGDFVAAADDCRRALATGADSGYVLALQARYPQLRVLENDR